MVTCDYTKIMREIKVNHISSCDKTIKSLIKLEGNRLILNNDGINYEFYIYTRHFREMRKNFNEGYINYNKRIFRG
jgi:hypothetical protein